MTTNLQRRAAGRWITAAAGAAIALLTLSPAESAPIADRYCVICGPMGGVDAVLNLLLFVPLGVGLAMAGVPAARAIALMVACTVGIEALQASIVPGRDASLGDVLMNSTGGALGVAIGTWWRTLVAPAARAARALAAITTCAWVLLQAVAAASFAPHPTAGRYYGQLGEPFGPVPVRFQGAILGAFVDGVAIPNGRFGDSDTVRALLARRDGVAARVRVVPAGSGDDAPPIVRIVDDEQRELLRFAQLRSDVEFGVRTGADVMRLRPWRLRLPGALALPATGRADTVSVVASYSLAAARLEAGTGGDAVRRTMRVPRISSGWQLFSPTSVSSLPGRVATPLGALWMIILAFPCGWFLAFSARARDARATAPLLHAAALATALGAIGWWSGVAAVPWEWMCAALGYAAGLVIARRLRLRAA